MKMDVYELVRRPYADWRRFRRWLDEQGRLGEEYWYANATSCGCAVAAWVRNDLLNMIACHTLKWLDPHVDKDGNLLIRGTTRIVEHEKVPASEWHRAFSKKYHEHCDKEKVATYSECIAMLDEVLDELGLEKRTNKVNWILLCHQAYKDWRRFRKWLQEHGKQHQPFSATLTGDGSDCTLIRWVRYDLMAEHDPELALKENASINWDGKVYFDSCMTDMVSMFWHLRFLELERDAYQRLGRPITADEALQILDKAIEELRLEEDDGQSNQAQ
jgi:hypothetical protein